MAVYLPTTFSTTTQRHKKPRHHRAVQAIRRVVSFFYIKYQSRGLRNLPAEPCVFVSNHCMAHGPITLCTRLKRHFRPWVIWRACFAKHCPDYALEDFWPGMRPRWFYWLLSRLTRHLLPFIMKGMQAIPAYRDSRSVITFRKSAETLKEGLDLVIFPETDRPYTRFVNDIDTGFVDVPRMMPKNRRAIPFVPVYIAPRLGIVCYGQPLRYDTTLSAEENRNIIGAEILKRIDAMARELPPHKPVNFRRSLPPGFSDTPRD